MSHAPALVVATAIFRRTGHKYRDRSYRYVLTDLGHALENLRVTAGALGVSAKLLAAFDESRAAQSLGVAEAEEGVLAVIALGAPAAAAGPSSSATQTASAPPDAESRWLAPSPAASGAALGVTAAVHAATSLRVASAPPPASPASAATPVYRLQVQALTTLPSATQIGPDWLAVIAKRRSVRRYMNKPLPLQVLADVLARMTPLHGPVLSAAVRVHLVAHDVAGLAPGAYRYEPERHALVRPRRLCGGRLLRRRGGCTGRREPRARMGRALRSPGGESVGAPFARTRCDSAMRALRLHPTAVLPSRT